jgi:hypothetical protein
LAPFAACLLKGDDVRRTDLVLPLAAALVGVALIVGLAAGLTDFEQEAALASVEIVSLLAAGKTPGLADKRSGQRNSRHYAHTAIFSITSPSPRISY